MESQDRGAFDTTSLLPAPYLERLQQAAHLPPKRLKSCTEIVGAAGHLLPLFKGERTPVAGLTAS